MWGGVGGLQLFPSVPLTPSHNFLTGYHQRQRENLKSRQRKRYITFTGGRWEDKNYSRLPIRNYGSQKTMKEGPGYLIMLWRINRHPKRETVDNNHHKVIGYGVSWREENKRSTPILPAHPISVMVINLHPQRVSLFFLLW